VDNFDWRWCRVLLHAPESLPVGQLAVGRGVLTKTYPRRPAGAVSSKQFHQLSLGSIHDGQNVGLGHARVAAQIYLAMPKTATAGATAAYVLVSNTFCNSKLPDSKDSGHEVVRDTSAKSEVVHRAPAKVGSPAWGRRWLGNAVEKKLSVENQVLCERAAKGRVENKRSAGILRPAHCCSPSAPQCETQVETVMGAGSEHAQPNCGAVTAGGAGAGDAGAATAGAAAARAQARAQAPQRQAQQRHAAQARAQAPQRRRAAQTRAAQQQ